MPDREKHLSHHPGEGRRAKSTAGVEFTCVRIMLLLLLASSRAGSSSWWLSAGTSFRSRESGVSKNKNGAEIVGRGACLYTSQAPTTNNMRAIIVALSFFRALRAFQRPNYLTAVLVYSQEKCLTSRLVAAPRGMRSCLCRCRWQGAACAFVHRRSGRSQLETGLLTADHPAHVTPSLPARAASLLLPLMFALTLTRRSPSRAKTAVYVPCRRSCSGG